ncbi:MAG: ECF-type sigma factor [Dokdonella sp.]
MIFRISAGLAEAYSEAMPAPVPATASTMEATAPPTDLLVRARRGDRAAYDRVFASAYSELQALAQRTRRRVGGATLNTTGLVHECYLRLIKSQPETTSAGHFLAIAAQAMRHLLIEMARARITAKRGGEVATVSLDELDIAETRDAEELLAIDDLLCRLELEHPQQAAVVACRFFAGLSDEETATALALSARTVQREWSRARDWLAAQGRS